MKMQGNMQHMHMLCDSMNKYGAQRMDRKQCPSHVVGTVGGTIRCSEMQALSAKSKTLFVLFLADNACILRHTCKKQLET